MSLFLNPCFCNKKTKSRSQNFIFNVEILLVRLTTVQSFKSEQNDYPCIFTIKLITFKFQLKEECMTI